MLTITIGNIQDLNELKWVQVLNRNLLLNQSCLRYFQSIEGLITYLNLKGNDDLLWNLHPKRVVRLLNEDLAHVLEERPIQGIYKCHDIRKYALKNLLKNPMYSNLKPRDLSEIFGMTPSYLKRFTQ